MAVILAVAAAACGGLKSDTPECNTDGLTEMRTQVAAELIGLNHPEAHCPRP